MWIQDFEVKVKKAFDNQPFPGKALLAVEPAIQDFEVKAKKVFERPHSPLSSQWVSVFCNYIVVPISPTELFTLRLIEP